MVHLIGDTTVVSSQRPEAQAWEAVTKITLIRKDRVARQGADTFTLVAISSPFQKIRQKESNEFEYSRSAPGHEYS